VPLLTIVERVIFLQNVDVFAEIPSEQLSYLAAIAEEQSFTEGDDIYKINDPSTALYVVLDGQVNLQRDGRTITEAKASDPFGTWALFDDKPRVTGATAASDTNVLCIYRDDFLDLLSDHSQITEGVLKTLVTRLRKLVDRVAAPPVQNPQSEE
jgi:CRP/FNR family cyclic AMP-dependent transcriptional regulator